MTGDRRLKPHEMKLFLEQKHASLGFDTIKETLFTGGEPTLFEVAFLEIIAKLESHQEIIVNFLKWQENQGAEIKLLRKALGSGGVIDHITALIRTQNVRFDEFDERMEKFRELLVDQVRELKQLTEEFKE